MANDNAKFSDNAINAGAIMGEGGTISGGNIVASSDDVARKVRGETEGKKDYNIQTLISSLMIYTKYPKSLSSYTFQRCRR